MDSQPIAILCLPSNDQHTPFPALDQALREPNGLLMAGGNLSPQRLLSAYQQGIFPWYNPGEPILWWSPDPRCVLWPQAFKVSRSLRKTLRTQGFEIRVDSAFETVIKQCSQPRQKSFGTWISTDIQNAYTQLHHAGYAHSYETWYRDELVGGFYGIQLGKVFFGESMFSRMTDASKVALHQLCQNPDIELIDCQVSSTHLLSLGAEEIPRTQFAALLNKLTRI